MHTVIGIAGNVNDVTQIHALPHNEETDIFTDAGHRGANKRHEAKDVKRRIVLQPGQRKVLNKATMLGTLPDNIE